ncbi:spore gernimation protein GerPD [Halobacillus sp. A5]|uniref:spore gernimation protein GerPD n=1 Tax=Halobacillus sp. A5 TaxID=2880263 RepID=UPI0020A6CBD5|nr:spore gernimation protein GerPD [Halobacillus sp. A5]MCP3026720.1 spore gernimation protein GerPD [Halobacillus sp. A5]
MKFTVHNYGLNIGNVHVTSVTTSSVFLIGDNRTIRLRSYFDTPPESLIIGPYTSPPEEIEDEDS